jgi:hypothetical protein
MSNLMLDVLAALVVLVQAGALGCSLWRRNLVFVVALNLLAAIAVLIAVIPNLIDFRSFADEFVEFLVTLFVAEMVALVGSLVWLAYRRLGWLVWIAFAVNAILSAWVLEFVLTFKITRLI